jgi:CubicO group peptidase (beta-lactamase class C family)
MTRVLLHIFFLLLISFFASTQSVDLVGMEVKKVIDSTYQSLIKKNKVKGLSLAIVDQGKLVYAQGYGFENEEKKIPATSKSIYRVGSITKSFTALSLMQLQEQGKLHLDDELKQHIPEFSIGFQNNTAHPIYLRKILSHTSGLPSDVMNGFFTENPPAVDSLIAQAKQLKMSYPNAYSHAYSNFGYALLGEVVERRSEKDYELYIRDQIFAPLKMTSSFIKLGEGMVTPPSYFKNELIDEPLIRDAPAGLIHSNVEDMSNYLLMYLGKGKFGDKRLVDSLAILEMEKDQTTDLVLENQGQFGLGLYSVTHYLKNGNDSSLVHVIGHGGDTYSFHADMKYIPELGVGVIVLTNSSSGVRIRSGEKLLEIYLKAKNGSTLGEVAVRPKPEIKKDFRKGTYVIMNSIVNCENEQKIKFNAGLAKVIAERDDAGYYTLKAVLFGFIPIKVKDQIFYFERIN